MQPSTSQSLLRFLWSLVILCLATWTSASIPSASSGSPTECQAYTSVGQDSIPRTFAPVVATSTLMVPYTPEVITQIRVTDLHIRHWWVGDLRATLTAPNGHTIVLFDRPGHPATSGGCFRSNIRVSLDDAAALSAQDLEEMCEPSGPLLYAISGDFMPITPLAGFNGSTPSGVWTLTVTDAFGFEGGLIHPWTLEICTAPLSTCSILDARLGAVSCHNGGTGTDGTDDAITFSLDPLAAIPGSGYTVSVQAGAVFPTTAIYGERTTFQLQPGSAGGGPVTLTLTDQEDAQCTTTVWIPDPGPCSNHACHEVSSADTPLPISSVNSPIVTSTITVQGQGSIAAVRIKNLDISHTFVGDLRATLTSPSGTTVMLFDRPGRPPGAFNAGCSEDNLLVTFYDWATATAEDFEQSCQPSSQMGDYAIAGDFQPMGSLSQLAGEPQAGEWTLTVRDLRNGDGGTINGWTLELCADEACTIHTSAQVPVAIAPSGNPTITSTLQVPDGLHITGIRVKDLHIAHTRLHHLSATLRSPSGTEVRLFHYPGVPTPTTVCLTPDMRIDLADDAPFTAAELATACNRASNTAPSYGIAGTFMPMDALAAFLGESPGGTWTLTVRDHLQGHGGALLGWGLDLCTALPLTCQLVDAGLSSIRCHDNGTPNNPDDDRITFALNPAALNASEGYRVSADVGELAQDIGSYGQPTVFSLSPGSAGGGPVTLTVADLANPSCNLSVTLADPGGCSIPADAVCQVYTTEGGTDLYRDRQQARLLLNVPDNGIVARVKVNSLRLLHGTAGSLSATLTAPDGTVVRLFNSPDDGQCPSSDLSVSFADDAELTAQDFVATCLPFSHTHFDNPYSLQFLNPAISGHFQPLDPLAAFAGKSARGAWVVTVRDETTSDLIQSAEADIEICAVPLPNCQLNDTGLSQIACHQNGTPADPSDDYVTFSLQPTGVDLGAGYQVQTTPEGATAPLAGLYGTATQFSVPLPVAANQVVLTVADALDETCRTRTTSVPATCMVMPGTLCTNHAGVPGPHLLDGWVNSGQTMTTTHNIAVPHLGTVASVRVVGLSMNHTALSHLKISLRSPSGTTVTLLNRPGVAPAGHASYQLASRAIFNEISFEDLGLIDQQELIYRSRPQAPPTPTLTGSLRPSQPLSRFMGEATTGTWQLIVESFVSTQQSYLQNWGLEICRTNTPLCNLREAGLQQVSCHDNGTPEDPSDDVLTFTLAPQGLHLGTGGYSVSVSQGTITPASGQYGVPTVFSLQPGSVGGGDVSVYLSDATSGYCRTQVLVRDDCRVLGLGCQTQEADIPAGGISPFPQGGTTAFFPITMPQGGAVKSVRLVNLHLNYSIPAALRAALVSPSGTVAPLFGYLRDTTQYTHFAQACQVGRLELSFADDAPLTNRNLIFGCDRSDPLSETGIKGTYQPEGDFARFTGEEAGGIWRLYLSFVNSVFIPTSGMASRLFGWGLEICTYQDGECHIVQVNLDALACNGDLEEGLVSFTLNPSGLHLGPGYTVSANHGAVTPASATYDTATTFHLPASALAEGNVTLTVIDQASAQCATPAKLVAPPPCNREGMACDLYQGTGLPVNIGFNAPQTTTFKINVPAGGLVSKIRIADLDIQHLAVSELVATLTSPSGTVVPLFDRPGFSISSSSAQFEYGDYSSHFSYCVEQNMKVAFDDDAPRGNEDLGRSYSTSFLPQSYAMEGVFRPLGSLSDFIMEPAGGQWTLTLRDVVPGSFTGRLRQWQLEVCTFAGEECRILDAGLANTACDDNGTPQITHDDVVSFTLAPQGVQLGEGYTLTAGPGVTLLPAEGSHAYGVTTPFSLRANGLPAAALTLTDADGGTCSLTLQAPPNCRTMPPYCQRYTSTDTIPRPFNQLKIQSVLHIDRDIAITDLRVVDLGLSASELQLIKASLTSPSGQEILLFNKVAAYGNTFSSGGCSHLKGLFDIGDGEAMHPWSLNNQCVSFGPVPPGQIYDISGAFRPVHPLSAFHGENARGDWTLTLFDIPWNTQLEGWGLDLCGTDLAICRLSDAGISAVTCQDNNTLWDPTDDYTSFSLQPTGAMLGTGYSLIGPDGGILGTGQYGENGTFSLPPGSVGQGLTHITVVDADFPATCRIEVAVPDPYICAPLPPGCADYPAQEGLPLHIPNTQSVRTSQIGVPGRGIVTGVKVQDLRLVHSYIGDLKVMLRSPQGTVVTLFNRPGTGPTSSLGCSLDNIWASFYEDAPRSAAEFHNTCLSGLYAIAGDFQPASPLSAFYGEQAAGLWTLIVQDSIFGDSGDLLHWTLEVCVSGESCDVVDTGLEIVSCDDNDTPNNRSDDTVIFTLNPTGQGLGTYYRVLANEGVVSPSLGQYGAPQIFTLQNQNAPVSRTELAIINIGGECLHWTELPAHCLPYDTTCTVFKFADFLPFNTSSYANTSWYERIINLPSEGWVTGIRLDSLHIETLRPGELRAELISPEGRIIPLFNHPGIPATPSGCPNRNVLVSFYDDAPQTSEDLEATCEPSPTSSPFLFTIAGDFQPIVPFSTLLNRRSQGAWRFRIERIGNTFGFTLRNWKLEICTSSVANVPPGAEAGALPRKALPNADPTAAGSFSLYPNPSTGLVTLELAGMTGKEATVWVRDALGRTLHSLRLGPVKEATHTLDLSGWPGGVYYLQLAVAGGEAVHTQKLVLHGR